MGKITLELIYEQMREVLVDQRQTANVLETKSYAFYAVATAVIGVVLPIVLQGTFDKTHIMMGLLAIPILLYVGISVLFYDMHRLKPFKKLGDPESMEDYRRLYRRCT